MKTGQSDKMPETTVKSNDLTQIRYNIIPFEKEMNGTKMNGYSYNYIEIEGEVTKNKVIDAIISNNYSKDNELALINNEIAAPGTVEYKQYQAIRADAKNIATNLGF